MKVDLNKILEEYKNLSNQDIEDSIDHQEQWIKSAYERINVMRAVLILRKSSEQ